MFDQLSINPTYDLGEGVEILLATAGESRALYIDGEMIFSYDQMSTGILMDEIAEYTDGNIGGYREVEALYDSRFKTSLYNETLPEDPSDIIFSPEVEIITVSDAEDLREKLQLQRSSKNYVIVRIRAGIIDEQMVKDYASESILDKIIDIQDRA